MENISELHAAASLGEIDTLYKVIQQNPCILEVVDAVPFVNTPLHTAAYAGQLEFSIEIMRLKPSFGWKLNEQGFSPIHIALHNNQHNLVRRLVEINKDLVRVKGREGITPLHFVCQSGDGNENMKLLIDLLEVCPDSIEDVNVRNETALHISLKNGNFRALRELVGWLATNVRKDAYSLERSVLNWKDSAGNTILHIAILNDNKQAFELLIKVVSIDAKNLENQTALDLTEARHPLRTMERTLLNVAAKLVSMNKRILVSNDSNGENILKKSEFSLIHYLLTPMLRITAQISEEQRNAYMVVGTLIATAIYQTVLSPPGGLTQAQGSDNNNLVNATSSLNSTAPGKIVMPHKVYSVVKSLNACIFVGGVIIIYLLMPKPSHVFSSLACTLLLIFIASYFVSESVISP